MLDTYIVNSYELFPTLPVRLSLFNLSLGVPKEISFPFCFDSLLCISDFHLATVVLVVVLYNVLLEPCCSGALEHCRRQRWYQLHQIEYYIAIAAQAILAFVAVLIIARIQCRCLLCCAVLCRGLIPAPLSAPWGSGSYMRQSLAV
jgi:hypothetical protein